MLGMFRVLVLLFLVRVVAIDHMRRDVVMEKAGHNLDTNHTAKEACDKYISDRLWRESAFDEIALGGW